MSRVIIDRDLERLAGAKVPGEVKRARRQLTTAQKIKMAEGAKLARERRKARIAAEVATMTPEQKAEFLYRLKTERRAKSAKRDRIVMERDTGKADARKTRNRALIAVGLAVLERFQEFENPRTFDDLSNAAAALQLNKQGVETEVSKRLSEVALAAIHSVRAMWMADKNEQQGLAVPTTQDEADALLRTTIEDMERKYHDNDHWKGLTPSQKREEAIKYLNEHLGEDVFDVPSQKS